MKSNGIDTGIHYPIPIHMQKAYKRTYKKNLDLKNTEKQSKEILSLPINEFLQKKRYYLYLSDYKKFF